MVARKQASTTWKRGSMDSGSSRRRVLRAGGGRRQAAGGRRQAAVLMQGRAELETQMQQFRRRYLRVCRFAAGCCCHRMSTVAAIGLKW